MIIENKEIGVRFGIKGNEDFEKWLAEHDKQIRAEYETECEKIYEENPPLHFSKEQIMWIREHIKMRVRQERAEVIAEISREMRLLYGNEYEKKIRADFAHELKETFNCELPSNYSSTQPFFTLENVRALVDMVLKEQK